MTTDLFGIAPATATAAAQALGQDARALASTALSVRSAVVSAGALPGGRTAAALDAGAERVGAAVEGEAVVVDVLGADLSSFVGAVLTTDGGSAESLTGVRP